MAYRFIIAIFSLLIGRDSSNTQGEKCEQDCYSLPTPTLMSKTFRRLRPLSTVCHSTHNQFKGFLRRKNTCHFSCKAQRCVQRVARTSCRLIKVRVSAPATLITAGRGRAKPNANLLLCPSGKISPHRCDAYVEYYSSSIMFFLRNKLFLVYLFVYKPLHKFKLLATVSRGKYCESNTCLLGH